MYYHSLLSLLFIDNFDKYVIVWEIVIDDKWGW